MRNWYLLHESEQLALCGPPIPHSPSGSFIRFRFALGGGGGTAFELTTALPASKVVAYLVSWYLPTYLATQVGNRPRDPPRHR